MKLKSILTQCAHGAFVKSMEAMAAFSQPINMTALVVMAESMVATLQTGNKIMVCGNGGSACQAMHFAEELTGRYRHHRRPLAALCLTDASHITCVANDYGYEYIFSRAIEAYAKPGDMLLILSTSGRSQNLIKAAEVAQQCDVSISALLGKGGGALKPVCGHFLMADGETSDIIQNIHMVAIHVLIELIERVLFPELY